MIQEVSILLHGGTGEVLFTDYLYWVGLHLLAVAVVAAVVHWGVGVLGSTKTPVAESDVEERGR